MTLFSQEELKLQTELINFLKYLHYPDAQRISREILEFSTGEPDKTETVKNRLATGEPWEYIKGWAEFCGLRFKVDKNVLIPRIETEKLVGVACEEAEKALLKGNTKKLNIVDVGTGSGCIIVAVAHELSKYIDRIKSFATDLSSPALKVAESNARRILNKSRLGEIKFFETNLIEGIIKDGSLTDSPTLLLANLPYISTEQYNKLHRSVKDFEPHLALDGGEDGLSLYRKLLIQAKPLRPVSLITETDTSNINSLKELMETLGYRSITIKDCFEIERFIRGEKR